MPAIFRHHLYTKLCCFSFNKMCHSPILVSDAGDNGEEHTPYFILFWGVQGSICKGNNFYRLVFLKDTALFLLKLFNLVSSNTLNLQFEVFLRDFSLSKVIGSITKLEILQTLVYATYVSPVALSEGPKSVHTSFSVRPCALWMVIDHASLRGYCCLSSFCPVASE